MAAATATADSSAANAAMYAWKPKTNPWLIAATVALAAFMEVLDTSIANVALPHIAGSLGASSDQSTWGVDFLSRGQRHCPSHGGLGGKRCRAEKLLHALHRDFHRQLLPLRNRSQP